MERQDVILLCQTTTKSSSTFLFCFYPEPLRSSLTAHLALGKIKLQLPVQAEKICNATFQVGTLMTGFSFYGKITTHEKGLTPVSPPWENPGHEMLRMNINLTIKYSSR